MHDCGGWRHPFSLQPALWRHLHESGGTFSETGSRLLPGARVEESLLRARECPGGTMQSEEQRESQDAPESRLRSVRAHSNWFSVALNFDIIHEGMYQNLVEGSEVPWSPACERHACQNSSVTHFKIRIPLLPFPCHPPRRNPPARHGHPRPA